MLLLLTPRQLARLNPSPESMNLLRTGEIRLAHPSDHLIELSENALFLVRLSPLRITAAVVATVDRARLILPLKTSKILRFYAIRFTARQLWRTRSRKPRARLIRKFSTGSGATARGPRRGLLLPKLSSWFAAMRARYARTQTVRYTDSYERCS